VDAELAHHPDMKDDTPASGLVCFLDKDRPCGADCMAFVLHPGVRGGEQAARCLLLGVLLASPRALKTP
jgi:hypothetical protein